MATDVETARDDLAYLRGLVAGGGRLQETMGEVFFWAGLIYGAQCLVHALQGLGLAPWQGPIALAILIGPSLAFAAIVLAIIWRDRAERPMGGAARAMNAVFQGAGFANLVLACVFGYGAHQAQSVTIWLYQPVVVCMFQSVAWFTAFCMLRRAWLGWAAFGWSAATVALGVLVYQPIAYLFVLSATLFLLLALPGWVIWRGAKRAG